MLNPLAMVGIYSFVFGVVFDAQAPIGRSSGVEGFALYLLAGLIPWNFFALSCNLGVTAISSNAALVRRVAFPREVLVFAQTLQNLVQFGIEITIVCVIFAFFGSPLLPWLPVVVLTSLLLALFGTGFALALSATAVYFRDLPYLWSILIQIWFFATPVIYPDTLMDGRGPGWLGTILDINPMRLCVGIFRDCIYHASNPVWTHLGVFALYAVVSLAAGWWLFLRMARRFAEEV